MTVTTSDIERWFIASWDAIISYTFERLKECKGNGIERTAVYAEKVLEHLAGRMGKSRAKCPQQLRKWFYRQIDRHVEMYLKSEKDLREAKPMVYEQHGAKVFIDLLDADGQPQLWIIPADRLDWARQLWPVYIRRYPDGRPYVARKVPVLQADGSHVQVEAGLHRIFMGLGAVKHNYNDAAEIRAVDGNWLNFADDNLRFIKGSDLLSYCRRIGKSDHYVTEDWKPASSVVTRSSEGRSDSWNDRHEQSVRNWLSGGVSEYDCLVPVHNPDHADEAEEEDVEDTAQRWDTEDEDFS
jgi:hypothetical protein